MTEMAVNVVEIGGIETEVVKVSKDKTKVRVRAGPYIIPLERRGNGYIGKVEGERSYFLSIRAYTSRPIPKSCFVAARTRADAILPSSGRHPNPKKVEKERKEPFQSMFPFN